MDIEEEPRERVVRLGSQEVMGGSSSSSSSSSFARSTGEERKDKKKIIKKKKIYFARSICGRTGDLRYFVDNSSVTQEHYLQELAKIRILTKARNFLVFQGDIEHLTLKQGKELTMFFEKICESDVYKEECDRLQLEKAKADETARCFC